MTPRLKTNWSLGIVVFCALGILGCSDQRGWDGHVPNQESRKDVYLGPEISRRARMDAAMAETPGTDDRDNDLPAQ